MQSVATVPALYLLAPIAAATVLNAFLFAGAWRGHQIERQTGRDPWWSGAVLSLYIAVLVCILYAYRGQAASNSFDIFSITIAGQAYGVVIIYSLLHAFVFTRGKSFKDRVFPMMAALGLLAMMIGATLSALFK